MKTYFYYFILLFITTCIQAQVPAYKNPELPVETRVSDLLSRMTLQEKIAQMQHIHSDMYESDGSLDSFKLAAFCKNMSYGCIEGFPFSAVKYAGIINQVQKYMVEQTRLGIPVLPVTEGLHGIVQDGSTIYPQAIAQGSTFNDELINKMAQQIGEQASLMGIRQILSPDLDIARDLRWGRVEETYGEDPYMNGTMGIAFVKGVRNANVACTPKHFLAHGTPTGGLNLSSVQGGPRELFSSLLIPFEMVYSHTDPLSTMNCYSSYDGEVVASSDYYLTDILRKKLGFKGYVYSDWGSVDMMRYFHKIAKTDADAARLAVEAGIDLEAGSSTYKYLEQLVKDNKLDSNKINLSVSRILYVKFKLGLFENPYADISKLKEVLHSQEQIKLAKDIALESIVLLKNENLLPLDLQKLKSIAIIGPNANQVQFGDYSWTRSNKHGITLLKAMQDMFGKSVDIKYAQGCDHWSADKSKMDEAVKVASVSDVSIIVVGTQSASLSREYSQTTCGEGFDLSDLALPGVQEDLIRNIHATGKPVIVVLLSGKPLAIPWIKQNIPAILVQWYGGEQQGIALSETLFGKNIPSGKLNVSFPQSVGHLPCYYNFYPSDKGYYKQPGTPEKPGRDYVFSNPNALWSFGHGLSYTTFEYIDVNVSDVNPDRDDTITVTVKIKNTGIYDAKEVVQLYVNDVVSSVITPVQQLKAFKKVFIKAGETKTVILKLSISELFLYNKNFDKTIEDGDFELQIGTSSDKILIKKTITIGELPKISNNNLEALNIADSAQVTEQVTIIGTIRDVQSTVIPYATIKVKGAGTFVTSDAMGKYMINATKGLVLEISHENYETRYVKIENANTINVTLTKR